MAKAQAKTAVTEVHSTPVGGGNEHTIAAEKKHARKIVKRAMSKQWWFQCEPWDKPGHYLIRLSPVIDLEKDIRKKIDGVKFEEV